MASLALPGKRATRPNLVSVFAVRHPDEVMKSPSTFHPSTLGASILANSVCTLASRAAVAMALGVSAVSFAVAGGAGSVDVDGCGDEQAATSASAASPLMPGISFMFIPRSESAGDAGRRGTDPR